MARSVDVSAHSPLMLEGGTHTFDAVRFAEGGHIEVRGAATISIGKVESITPGAGAAAGENPVVIVMRGMPGMMGSPGMNGPNGTPGASGPIGAPGAAGGGGGYASAGSPGASSPPAIFAFENIPNRVEVHFIGGDGGAGGNGGNGGQGGNGGNGTSGPGGSGGFGGHGGNGGNGGDGGNGGPVTIYYVNGNPSLSVTVNLPGGAGGRGGLGGGGGAGGYGNPTGSPGPAGTAGMAGAAGRPGVSGPVTLTQGRPPES
jgi:hypothetical protein